MRCWLKDIRGDRTHREVARLIGISRSYYSQIEGGVRNPSVNCAKKIAEALGFEWTDFFNSNWCQAHPDK